MVLIGMAMAQFGGADGMASGRTLLMPRFVADDLGVACYWFSVLLWIWPPTARLLCCVSAGNISATGRPASSRSAVACFPRVLFVAPTERRAGMLERAIKTARHLNHELFAVTTTEDALDSLTGATS